MCLSHIRQKDNGHRLASPFSHHERWLYGGFSCRWVAIMLSWGLEGWEAYMRVRWQVPDNWMKRLKAQQTLPVMWCYALRLPRCLVWEWCVISSSPCHAPSMKDARRALLIWFLQAWLFRLWRVRWSQDVSSAASASASCDNKLLHNTALHRLTGQLQAKPKSPQQPLENTLVLMCLFLYRQTSRLLIKWKYQYHFSQHGVGSNKFNLKGNFHD